MNWGAPDWLRLLLVPVAGAILLLAMKIVRRRERSIRWPGIKRVVAAGSRVLPVRAGRSMTRPWFLLLASAAIVVALARPRWGEIEKPVIEHAREVMIALDLSKSMLVQDVPPDRLSRARLLVQGLIDGLKGERVGLIVFAGTAFVQVPLSSDYQILNEFLPELNPNYMPQGGTDYAGMLEAAIGGFSETSNTDRYLIVLSDGEALDESWKSKLPALAKRGVHVIALGLGTPNGGFIPDGQSGFVKDERGAVVMSRLESNTLRSLATETRGVYRDASAWVDLGALLQQTIERGRRGQFTEKKAVDHIERFQWLLAAALVLCVLGIWREIAIRPRPRSIESKPVAASPRKPKPAAAPASLVRLIPMLLVPVLIFSRHEASVAAEPTPAPDPTPDALVRKTVSRLSEHGSARAADWLELARRTLNYGQGARQKNEPIEPGAIQDALDAVVLGKRIDPSMTDWGKLRSDLEELLKQQQQQQQQQQDQNKQNQEDQKEQQDKQKPSGNMGDKQPGDKGRKDQENQGENGEQDQQGDQQQQQEGAQDQQQSSQGKQESGDQQQQQKKSDDGQSSPDAKPQPPDHPPTENNRLGDYDNESEADVTKAPPTKEEAKAQSGTRKIGGRPANEKNPTPADPEMAAAMQRMREATDDDSPARLFELLEGKPKDNNKSGKDW